MITPTQHEKNEWARMAQAAYRLGINSLGHTYSVAASMSNGQQMNVAYFDVLQYGYRRWLTCGAFDEQHLASKGL